MPHLAPIDANRAPSAIQELFDRVRDELGSVPNLFRTLAHSPAALAALLDASAALAEGALSPRLREQVSLAVAESNLCGYCLAAHSAAGAAVGLSDEEIADARRGASPDRRTDAALSFARRIVATGGRVAEADLARIRRAGFDEPQITELIVLVGLQQLTNTFNLVAGTEVDFPPVESREAP